MTAVLVGLLILAAVLGAVFLIRAKPEDRATLDNIWWPFDWDDDA